MSQINRYILSFVISLNLSYLGLCAFIHLNFRVNNFFVEYSAVTQLFKSAAQNLFALTSMKIIFLPLIIFIVTFSSIIYIIHYFVSRLTIEAENDFTNAKKQYVDVNFLRQKMLANFVVVGDEINTGNVMTINDNNLNSFSREKFSKDKIYYCSEEFLPRLLDFILSCDQPIKLLLQISSLAKFGNIIAINSEIFYFSSLKWRSYLTKIVNLNKYVHNESNVSVYAKETGEVFQLIYSRFVD